MITILSPSKSVTNRTPPVDVQQTEVLFPDQTAKILAKLQALSVQDLQHELQISERLAELNYDRFTHWSKTPTKSALWLYSGDVYNGLDSFTMSSENIAYAQNHILIVSGLYGLVRPLDAIKPYRLEMKLSFSGQWGRDLYQAWQQPIADYIAQTKTTTILMCASKEYAKSVVGKLPSNIDIITPRFMQQTPKGLTEKGLFAKYARGALARWVINNEVESIHALRNYKQDGFTISEQYSTANEIVFIVPKNFSLQGRFTKQ